MLKKFIDENDRSTGYGSLDFPLYRYAEVLLDYVECLVETGIGKIRMLRLISI